MREGGSAYFATLAHGNPGDGGDRVRLNIRGHHRP